MRYLGLETYGKAKQDHMGSDKCWRCGGEPHEFENLKPRRPVCANCAWELVSRFFDDEEFSPDTEEEPDFFGTPKCDAALRLAAEMKGGQKDES